MLNDAHVIEAVRLIDREITLRLRRTADESVQWAEQLFDILSHLQECHRQTVKGVDDRFKQAGPLELDWGLRLYLLDRQRAFSAILADAFLALQIQDVTSQAIERACGTMEACERQLGEAPDDEIVSLAERLTAILREYVESDDQHRSQEDQAA